MSIPLDPVNFLLITLVFMGHYWIAFYNGRRYERDHRGK